MAGAVRVFARCAAGGPSRRHSSGLSTRKLKDDDHPFYTTPGVGFHMHLKSSFALHTSELRERIDRLTLPPLTSTASNRVQYQPPYLYLTSHFSGL